MNTGKEGKARQYMKSSSYTKATEPCQQAGPRDSSQLPCGEGKVQGQAACRLEVHPPEGSHTTAVLPAAAAKLVSHYSS